jgi:ABC-type glycerol-3-phosphate transport system substrate-binding protein
MRIFALLLLLLSITACGKERIRRNHAIEYWSSNNGGEIQFSKWAVERWNKAHPDAVVKY